jgi:anaerobic dimethyl sulfoxide reductase subunit A
MFEERHFFGNMYAPKIIEPQGEAKDLMWIQTQLAKRLGLLDLFMPLYTTDKDWDNLMESLHKEAYEKWAAARGINIPWEEFKKKPIIHRDVVDEINYPFKAQIQKGEKFNTRTGKIEIYSEYLAKTDLKRTQYGGYIDPLPVYRPVWEGFYDPKAQKYPLMAITPHGRYRIHSVQDSNPWLSQDAYRHSVWINVADAKARGIKDGDLVRVYNDVGETVIPAYVTSRIVPGVVCLYEGAWYNPNAQSIDRRGCSDIICYNESAAQRYPGAGAWPFTALVEVEKF